MDLLVPDGSPFLLLISGYVIDRLAGASSFGLQLLVALIADPLGLFVALHSGRLGRAVLAEDLAAVPAVVLSVGEGELAVAAVAGSGLGVVSPLAASLLRKLNLEKKRWIRKFQNAKKETYRAPFLIITK